MSSYNSFLKRNHNFQFKRVAYLSGAPRVSTRPEAEATGPRSHVIGVMQAFERLGWEVNPYIVGDLVPLGWIKSGSEQQVRKNTCRRLAADILRILMNFWNSRQAWRKLGQADWVYERFGAFQSLGRIFQKRRALWILETNAPLYKEAVGERQTILLKSIVCKFEREAYRKCDVLVCISEVLRDVLVEDLGLDSKKIVVMPNAVDASRFSPKNLPSEKGPLTLGWVGSIWNWAGLHLLIQAIKKLSDQGLGIRAKLIGDGPEKENLQRLAYGLGLKKQIEFIGRIPWDEVSKHLDEVDLCFSGQIPIKCVGKMYLSPLKLYEYMAMARPVIASSFEDARRIVIEEQTGFVKIHI